jgi:hypothetical protein
MGTIADTPLVSNKVFQAIQPYQTIKEVTGTVVYANKYADVAEVPMPDWIRVILDSDAGTVGTNPLIQLKGKLEYLADGPWYVDSRNGMVYIHNKKFREDSIHTYVYQSENGEVIRVSFETQRVKHVDVAKALGIDPKSKELEKEKAATDEIFKKLDFKWVVLNDATRNAKPQIPEMQTIWKNDKPRILNYDRNRNIETPDNFVSVNNATRAWMEFNDFPGSNEQADKQAYYQVNHTNHTLRGNQLMNDMARHFRTQSGYSRDLVSKLKGAARVAYEDQYTEDVARNMKSLEENLSQAIYKAKQKKQDPRPAIKALADRYFGVGATHTYTAKVWKREYVDPATYKGNNTFDPSYNEGSLEKMRQDPNIMIIGELKKVPTKTYHKYNIEIFHLAHHRVKVSLAQELTDWALRQIGYDTSKNGASGWKQDKMSNSSGSWEEKKLVVKMDVVGRPSLASSQILTLLNVGQRWSGNYYIKTCTHRMDAAEGYICSIELSQNRGKPGVHTKEDKINTEKLVKDNAQGNNRNQSRGIKKVTTKAVTTTTRDYKKPQSTKRSKTSNNKRYNNSKPAKRK